MKLGSAVTFLVLAACGAATQAERPAVQEPTPPSEAAPRVAEAEAPAPAPSEAERSDSVRVRGIEGSMGSYDVRTTMDGRSEELAACHEPRARVVPALTGEVEYGIKVDGEGRVGEVTVKRSDLGDRTLERCVGEVILRTLFPPPNGGDARFTWTLALEPAIESAQPEAWERDQIEQVLAKHLPTLHEDCGIERKARHLGATAYVNKRGKVVAASVTGKASTSDEDKDCIVLAMSKWLMPRPKHSRFAKVSFPLAPVPQVLAKGKAKKRR